MNSLARILNAAFSPSPREQRPSQSPAQVPTAAGRGRRKLWQMAHKWHCPIVGTCLSLAELRKLARRAGMDDGMSDYALHVTVVGHCDERSALTEEIQRYLDKRHAVALKRFARAGNGEDILKRWREALSTGEEVAGALWAAWTHGSLDDEAGQAIFGDIHMLSHQAGASVRANLARLTALEQHNAHLRGEAEALRHGLSVAQRDGARKVAALEKRVLDAETRAALLSHRELELAQTRAALRDYTVVRDRADALAARVERLEERNADNARRAKKLAGELNEAQDALAATEAALELALGMAHCPGVSGTAGCGSACPAEVQLAGRCVLCIGGRANLVEGYRRLVETRGGRFLHHDGGQEESLHRLDAVVAGADAVVCQAGCVSHAAYYRLKEACKKLNKPCVFVKSPGVGSFARGLVSLTAAGGELLGGHLLN